MGGEPFGRGGLVRILGAAGPPSGRQKTTEHGLFDTRSGVSLCVLSVVRRCACAGCMSRSMLYLLMLLCCVADRC